MPHHPRGKLQFEHRETGKITGARDLVESFSCHPPPAGTRTGANPVLTINPHQPANHVQPEERRRIETFGKKTANENLRFATVIDELKTAFKIEPLTIDLSTLDQSWRRPTPCFDDQIFVEVESILLRIDVNASEPVTLDGVTWPTGDSVAQFRIVVPHSYRFVRVRTYNVNCCPLPDGAHVPPPFEETGAWSLSNFYRLSYGIDLEWKPSLGLEYNWDKWKFHLPYEKWQFEEKPGEPFPDQPWILPLKPKF